MPFGVDHDEVLVCGRDCIDRRARFFDGRRRRHTVEAIEVGASFVPHPAHRDARVRLRVFRYERSVMRHPAEGLRYGGLFRGVDELEALLDDRDLFALEEHGLAIGRERLLVNVCKIPVRRGHAPTDLLVVADHHGGQTREGASRDMELSVAFRLRVELDGEPDARVREREVRIVCDDRVFARRPGRANGPVVRADIAGQLTVRTGAHRAKFFGCGGEEFGVRRKTNHR